VALIFLPMVAMGSSFNNVLQNTNMEFTIINGSTAGVNAYIGGYLYPKNAGGVVQTQYYGFWSVYAFFENGTNRDILPPTASQLDAYNPTPNTAAFAWNFSAPYSHPSGFFQFVALAKNQNTTFGNQTIVGQGGLKLTGVITGDSNLFNASSVKLYTFNLTLSHPILSFNQSNFPTPYQHNYVITTQYYSVIVNLPTYSISDGKQTGTKLQSKGFTSNLTYLYGIDYQGIIQWQHNWLWDPELGILLNPGVGEGDGGDGGGSSDTNLAYISLAVLGIVPFAVVALLLAGLVYFTLRRRARVNAVSQAIAGGLVQTESTPPPSKRTDGEEGV